jgi:hypothetical protein
MTSDDPDVAPSHQSLYCRCISFTDSSSLISCESTKTSPVGVYVRGYKVA